MATLTKRYGLSTTVCKLTTPVDLNLWREYVRQETEMATLKRNMAELEEEVTPIFERLKNTTCEQVINYLNRDGDHVGKFAFVMRWLQQDLPQRSVKIPVLVKHLDLEEVYQKNKYILETEIQTETGLLRECIEAMQIYSRILTGNLQAARTVSSSGSKSSSAADTVASPEAAGGLGLGRHSLSEDSESSGPEFGSTTAVESAVRTRQKYLAPSLPLKNPETQKSPVAFAPQSLVNSSRTRVSAPIKKAVKRETPTTPKSTVASAVVPLTVNAVASITSKSQRKAKTARTEPVAASESGKSRKENCSPKRPRVVTPPAATRVHRSTRLKQTEDHCLFYPNQERRGRFLYSFNWETQETTQLYKYEHPREYSAAVVVHGELYDLGGTETRHQPDYGGPSESSMLVEIFGIGKNRHRTRGLPMLEARKEFSACALNDMIYVIGGCIGDSAMNSCERLNPMGSSARWRFLPFLITPRGSHCTAVIDHKIFAIGGIGQETLDSVEAFDTDNLASPWRAVAPLAFPRGRHSSAVLNDDIYVIGGEDSAEVGLDTGEVFHPGANRWTMLPPMRNPRVDCGICVWNNQLIAVGGTTGFTEDLEAYDPRQGRWRRIAWPLGLHPTGRFYNAVSASSSS